MLASRERLICRRTSPRCCGSRELSPRRFFATPTALPSYPMSPPCLHCTRDLGQNDSVETLPIGRRIAFDAAKGRLWVVCRSCGKWNLVPFDNRLEAIDDCARLFHDTKTRFSTDNIGLARLADGLDLVRIGE